jgi:uncharacterized membrane protein
MVVAVPILSEIMICVALFAGTYFYYSLKKKNLVGSVLLLAVIVLGVAFAGFLVNAIFLLFIRPNCSSVKVKKVKHEKDCCDSCSTVACRCSKQTSG